MGLRTFLKRADNAVQDTKQSIGWAVIAATAALVAAVVSLVVAVVIKR